MVDFNNKEIKLGFAIKEDMNKIPDNRKITCIIPYEYPEIDFPIIPPNGIELEL